MAETKVEKQDKKEYETQRQRGAHMKHQEKGKW